MTTLEEVRRRAEADAKTFGYYLVPYEDLLNSFLEGLRVNEERYGYPVCPCRLASEVFEFDRDIICPCDYRDPDIAEYGACYCRLYVNKKVYESKDLPTVPERRPMEKQMRAYQTAEPSKLKGEKEMKEESKEKEKQIQKPKLKLIYCKQCGYVVFREDAPYVCPICKAKREMFEEITTLVDYSG